MELSMSKPAPDVTVLIPGLLESFTGIDPALFPDLPAIATLLGKGASTAATSSCFETVLCSLFDIHPDSNNELPIAQLTRRTDFDSSSQTTLLRADPVHLRADKTALRLFPADQLALTQDETDQIIQSLNEHYRSDGLEFAAPAPSRWYVSSNKPVSLSTQPLSIVSGKDIREYLPRGEDAAYWTGLFNEIQMLLHNHPVNLQRRDNRQPEVNSVWFWGGGELPVDGQPTSYTVLGNDLLTQGLAIFSSARFENAEISMDTVSRIATNEQNSLLIVRDDLLSSVSCGDFNVWCEVLKKIEQDLFKPLLSALKKGKIRSIELLPCNGRGYLIRRTQLLKFWKPATSFSEYAHKNATITETMARE